MIRPITFGLAVVFASGSFAQSPRLSSVQSPPIGAIIQVIEYDPKINMVTVTIANVSHKDITGYNLSVKETLADGSTDNSELLADYVGRIALVEEARGTADEAAIRKQFGDGLFHPGETRKEMVGVQPGAKDIQIVVDSVTYTDHTSESTNADGLQQIMSHRKQEIASTQLANEIIKAALADPNDADPAATAAKKIQERIILWKAQRHTTLDLETGTLRGVVDKLKGISSDSTNKRDALNQYLEKIEQRIATLSPHAELPKAVGPQ
jgi:hypothetical protein